MIRYLSLQALHFLYTLQTMNFGPYTGFWSVKGLQNISLLVEDKKKRLQSQFSSW